MMSILQSIIFMIIRLDLFGAVILDNELNDMGQTNLKLIQAIKEDYLISPPEKYLEYNFTRRLERIPINGEKNQPIHVFNQIFKNRIRNGFFIEAGAYDGEISSNTLFFELKQNWTGLLVEPNPDVFQMLNVKHRKAWLFGHCLSTNTTPETVDFDASGLYGGIIYNGQKPGYDPSISGYRLRKNQPYQRRTIKMQCFPLYSVLKALGNPTVHYFSLDVEGSEFQILKTIPFQDVDIKVLDIEIDRAGTIFPGTYEDISKYLDTQGYEFHSQITKYDAVFVKKGFLDEINEL